MRIDRSTFLLLTTSLASGCQSRASQSGSPEPMPRSEPVTIRVEAPAPESKSEPDAESLCTNMPDEKDCEGEGMRTFCGRYERYFRSEVAADAMRCLSTAGPDAACDRCVLTQCGIRALEQADDSPDEGCDRVEQACNGMGQLCLRYGAGQNTEGRRRFHKCLIDNCGIGVRYCLWDPSSTPCTESSGRQFDFEF